MKTFLLWLDWYTLRQVDALACRIRNHFARRLSNGRTFYTLRHRAWRHFIIK